MIAIIAEKPSTARDIARVVGAKFKNSGYMSGNGYMVTWAYGHLITPALPEDYGIDSFKLESLPILPEKFMLVPRKVKTKKGYQTDSTAKKQLNIIKEVFAKCRQIIVATDAGREGELIFRYIYHYLECKKPFSRLWISSLTDTAIQSGMENLKDGKTYDSLYLAAKARSEADWLIGINASRGLCLASGVNNNSQGRVQTPTLALICKRYLEHSNFTPQPYWQLFLKVRYGEQVFPVKGYLHYFDKADADKEYAKLKNQGGVKIKQIEQKDTLQEPPLLHDLASLQKEANNKFGFSADKTLGIAQKLYESNKLISYPRTGSRYIPQDVFATIPVLMDTLKLYPPFSSYATLLSVKKLNKRPVNARKVTDHHALIVTENLPLKLDKEETQIYELIAGRMLEAFSTPCVKAVTNVVVSCGDLDFFARGWKTKENGWRDVFNTPDEQNKEDDNLVFPPFGEGNILQLESYSQIQKNTKPNPLYTDATLLTAMETAGKDIEDEEVRRAMKDCGIGTPATRSGIIETLLEREYTERLNKNIIPTKKGMALYNSIKGMRIADVEMTGSWENALAKIERCPDFYDAFMNGMKVHARQVTDEIVSIIKAENTHIETPYICPRCRLGKMTIHQKIVRCVYSKCRFTLFREICGKTLTDNQLEELLKTGQSPLIKGFKSKAGKKFDAYIVFKDGKPAFKFPDKQNREDGKQDDVQ